MSTVQDEADIGLGEPDTEPSNDEHSTAEDAARPRSRNGTQLPSSIVEVLRSVRQDDLKEEQISQNGASFGSYGRLVHEDEEDETSIQNKEDVLASPAKERPSSADGSLSTPDDTPSIQVESVSTRCLRRPLSRAELDNLFAREAPLFRTWT